MTVIVVVNPVRVVVEATVEVVTISDELVDGGMGIVLTAVIVV